MHEKALDLKWNIRNQKRRLKGFCTDVQFSIGAYEGPVTIFTDQVLKAVFTQFEGALAQSTLC